MTTPRILLDTNIVIAHVNDEDSEHVNAYLIGLKYLKPATAGLWLTLTPVFGIAGAFVWLGEIPAMLMLTGTAIILTALIATRKEH